MLFFSCLLFLPLYIASLTVKNIINQLPNVKLSHLQAATLFKDKGLKKLHLILQFNCIVTETQSLRL